MTADIEGENAIALPETPGERVKRIGT